MFGKYLRLILPLYFLITAPAVRSQIMDTRVGVDTLTLAERISVRTNMADWVLLTPNIGFEFDVRSTNWNRWTAGVNLRYNWQTEHTYTPGIVYNIAEIKGEFRNYWRTREIDEKNGVMRHTGFIDRLFSCRRTRVKHPTTTYYRGLYAAYSDYSVKLGKYGYQGNAVSFGFTYGIVKPMYLFRNGNTLDFELGISAGAAYTKYDKYVLDRDNDCYAVVEPSQTKVVPVINDIRLGLVYRFGNYPITKKYRWRIETDAAYIDTVNAMNLEMERMRANLQNDESIIKRIHNDFNAAYDSIMAVRKADAVKAKAAARLNKKSIKADKGSRKGRKASEGMPLEEDKEKGKQRK